MSRRLFSKRGARRAMRNVNRGAEDVKGFVNENPLTSSFIALAAGAAATTVYKMSTVKPDAEPEKATAQPAEAKPAPKKKRKAAKAR